MDKKIIVIINEYKYSLKNILKDYSILEIKLEEIRDIYNIIDYIKEEIIVIYIDIKEIEKLKYLNKKINPDIIFIPKIENIYTKSIEEKEYKYIKKGLKKLRNKVLIINDNDKYLKNIFNNKLDIYRYGNNIYDDIEYIKDKNNLIIKYQDKKYDIKNKEPDIIGNIIIGLLFGENIENLIDTINNWENYLNSVYYLSRDVDIWK